MNIYAAILLIFVLILKYDDQIRFLETEWFQMYWSTISILIGIIYVGIVFGWRNLTKKPSFDHCEPYLRCWNFSLMIFSILGTYRTGWEFFTKMFQHGLVATFCDDDYHQDRSVYFWYFSFVCSKAIEMGDTMFLLAKNKPVRFIHWFHHLITMVYSFYIAAYLPAIGRWMSLMNFFVHSLMYCYYFLRSYHVRLPRFVPFYITTLQTLQMFIGLFINLNAYYFQKSFHDHSRKCGNNGYTVETGILMYLFYVCLFTQLLCNEFRKRIKFE